ncbi:MAG: restriction endonuclease subunit S [Sporocytophaga sp.]|nr:restriction endonuclease subunit S [Sporocytophaga sp.]
MDETEMKVPEGWERKSLIQLADYINGYGFKPSDWSKDGLPIIRIEQLKNPYADYDYCNFKIPDKNIINPGDLVFSWSASLFLRIWHGQKAALNQHLFKVLPLEGIDKHFLKFLLDNTIEDLAKNAQGSTMQHITRKELHTFYTKLPKSPTEQRQIATILSKVDEAISQTEKLITKYQRIKTGLMQDLLTKGIDEHGNIRSEETHEFKDSPLGRIPVEWQCVPLGSCIELHNNKRKPISSLLRAKMIGEYPYYGATGIIDNIDEFRVDGEFVLFGEDGDHFLKWAKQEQTILVNGRFNVSNHAHIVKGTENCSTKWIHYFFSHRDITFYLTRQGAGRFKLNKASLLSLPILIPSDVNEQNSIIYKIEKANLNISEIKDNLTKLYSIKTGLMQDLLSGKVRVNHLLKETEMV